MRNNVFTYVVQEAQQEVVPVDELVELATSNSELDLARGAEAYQEEAEFPVVVEEKESYLARKLHLLLKDHFHDQTGKDHQVHKILALQNRTVKLFRKKIIISCQRYVASQFLLEFLTKENMQSLIQHYVIR